MNKKLTALIISAATVFSANTFAYDSFWGDVTWKYPTSGGGYETASIQRDSRFDLNSRNVLSLNNPSRVIDQLDIVFPEIALKGDFTQGQVFNNDLIRGMKEMAGEVGCLIWKYKNRAELSTSCTEGKTSGNRTVTGVPFADTPYDRQALTINVTPTRRNRTIFDFRMESGDSLSPASLFYPIHEVGNTFYNGIARNSLVLSVGMLATKSVDGYPTDPFYPDYSYFWLNIPSEDNIAKQRTPEAARNYVEENVNIFIFNLLSQSQKDKLGL